MFVIFVFILFFCGSLADSEKPCSHVGLRGAEEFVEHGNLFRSPCKEVKVHSYYYIFTRRGWFLIRREVPTNEDKIETQESVESQEKVESETTVLKEAVISTERSHYDDTVNSNFDEIITKPEVIQNNDISDKNVRFYVMNESRWCLMRWNYSNGDYRVSYINKAFDSDEKPNEFDKKSQSHIKNETIIETSGQSGILNQALLTCAIVLLACGCGMPIGYSAVILPQLVDNPDQKLTMDTEMGSWVGKNIIFLLDSIIKYLFSAAVHSAATPVGSIMAFVLMNRYGRKMAILISIMPLIIGWILIALAPSHLVILSGRIVAGIGVGILSPVAQVLLAEISSPNIRGLLVGVPFVSYSMGILVVYGLGAFLDWRIVAWCGLLLPVLSFVLLVFTPESPTWLASKGQYEKAKKALAWLRGGVQNSHNEYNELKSKVEHDKLIESQEKPSVITTLKQGPVLKPLVLINAFNILQVMSGTYQIVFYAVDVITDIHDFKDSSLTINPMQSAVATAFIRLILSIIYCVLLLKVGRRGLYLSTCLLSGVSSIFLSVFLFIKGDSPKSMTDLYIIGAVMLIYISFNTACLFMPGILTGELLPLKVRHYAGVVFTFHTLLLFAAIKTFPGTLSLLRSQGIFMIFGIASLLAAVLFYYLLPETRNRSLNQIETYYQDKNWRWQTRRKDSDQTDQS
ncbi:unnamed protein product [Diamesa tonsa]